MSTLAKLRQQMKTCPVQAIDGKCMTEWIGMDAFIVGTEDAHQSEYVSEHDKRREFLSQFTGSAGTALVTANKAYLWTDGRYFLQAESQLSSDWTLMKSEMPGVLNLEDWVAENLTEGQRLGIDPFLTSVSFAKRLGDAINTKGIQLVKPKKCINIVDQVWEKQPGVSMAPVKLLDEKYHGQPIVAKLENLRNQMGAQGVDGIVLTALDDIAWLFNLRGSDIDFNPVCVSYAFVTMHKAILCINQKKLTKSVGNILSQDLEIREYDEILSILNTYCKDHPTHKLLVDCNQCNLAIYHAIPTEMRKEKQSLILQSKAVKNTTELEGMRQAHIRDGAALVSFFAWLDEQMRAGATLTEVEVAEKQHQFREKMEGFVSLSFDTISSIGPNGAIIHYKPEHGSCATLNCNQIYLNDSGGQYEDGTTDVTRTLHFGTPTNYEKQCFTAVLKGHIALAKTVFPEGIEGVKLDTIARTELWKMGLDYQHGTGHGVGAFLNVHEKGVLMSFRMNNSGLGIGQRMVVSNEPGYYEDGNFGIRIESVMIAHRYDKVASASNKPFCYFETITMAPIQRSLIDESSLSSEEIQWINNYHIQVREKLTPLLQTDPRALAYLNNQTTAI